MAMKKKVQPKKSGSGRYPGPGYDEAAEGRRRDKIDVERARAADKKSAPKKNAGVKPKPSTAAQIGKRFGITAREARDIATAMGTLGKAVKESSKFYGGDAVKNLKKQIAETGRAAVSGKRGTESDQIVSSPNYKGASAGFTGYPRNRKTNKPGRSITEGIDWYKKSKN